MKNQGYGIVVKYNQSLIKSSNEILNLFSANILVVYGGEYIYVKDCSSINTIPYILILLTMGADWK